MKSLVNCFLVEILLRKGQGQYSWPITIIATPFYKVTKICITTVSQFLFLDIIKNTTWVASAVQYVHILSKLFGTLFQKETKQSDINITQKMHQENLIVPMPQT